MVGLLTGLTKARARRDYHTPSISEAKLLQALEEHPAGFATCRQWAAAAGIHPATLSTALRTGRFGEVLRATIVAQLAPRAPALLAASVETAINAGHHGFRDRQMLLEILGLYSPRSETVVSGQVDVYMPDLVRSLTNAHGHGRDVVEGEHRELPAPGDGDGAPGDK